MSENNNPLVSVIIGTYNRSDKLKRCIDSILRQDYKNLEVIVIDDNSTDNTRSYLKTLELTFPYKLIFHTNSENKGISFNSNFGFSKCNGEFIALIGDDDYWHDTNKISKQVNAILHSESNIVCSWWYEKDSNDILREKCPTLKGDIISRILLKGGIVCGSTPLIRRSAWEKVGGFDEKMKRGTDSDLFRRIILEYGKLPIMIEQFTTTVDVSGNDRMTSNKLKSNFLDHLASNNRTIYKFWKILLLHPKALSGRILRSIKLFAKYMLLN